jgi:REP element-mobilizing transposase RayT
MEDKFRNKYRIPSARWQSWDYGRNGSYFITICTHGREHFFGTVKGGRMLLSEIGSLVDKFWHEIPEHFPFVELGAFVVMPNHIHGIITLNKMDDGGGDLDDCGNIAVETPKLGASTEQNHDVDLDYKYPNPHLNPDLGQPKSQGRTTAASKKWKPQTVGVIINQFKRICTIHARKSQPHFAWQERFHDRIIRNASEYEAKHDYILNNPLFWDEDKFDR